MSDPFLKENGDSPSPSRMRARADAPGQGHVLQGAPDSVLMPVWQDWHQQPLLMKCLLGARQCPGHLAHVDLLIPAQAHMHPFIGGKTEAQGSKCWTEPIPVRGAVA